MNENHASHGEEDKEEEKQQQHQQEEEEHIYCKNLHSIVNNMGIFLLEREKTKNIVPANFSLDGHQPSCN